MPGTLTYAPLVEGRTLALSGDAGDYLAMQATDGVASGSYRPVLIFRSSVSGGGVSLDCVATHDGGWDTVAGVLRAYATTGTGPVPTSPCATSYLD